MSTDGSSVLGSDPTLFEGLLAVRMGMVEQDVFRQAVEIWKADPSRSIGQVLRELGHIDPKETELLDAASHVLLERHGGDVNQAMAAMGGGGLADRGAEPAGLGNAGLPQSTAHSKTDRRTDAETVDQVPRVSASPDARTVEAGLGSDPLNEFEVSSGARGGAEAGGPLIADRYQILNLHAKGNLGEVFRARDHQLGRDVALKRIQARYADLSDRREQFEVEARITGRLEHPGIVPVYSLGHQADGRPCYSMRLIKGQSLRHAISDWHQGSGSAEAMGRDPLAANMALRGLIRRFISVCEAIAYAHSRGILHRDIKPSNIMVGEYGETLVVDWGLSKSVGAVDDPSSNGSSEGPVLMEDAPTEASIPGIKGTVPYMSPEQARGEVLTPASDIYSLGGTLFSILTGRLPYEGTKTEQVLLVVGRGESVAPRSIRRDVPAALDAICRKAMGLKPEDRYLSARELAEDLTRWIDDEPVRAYEEPWTERLGRWARHHQASVGVVAATLAVGALASLPLLMLYQRESEAKEAVVRSNAQLVIAKEEADRRFNETCLLVDEFTGLIDGQLLLLPGSENFRKLIVEKAADRYERFLKERPESVELARQAADVFRVAANSNRSMETEGALGGRTETLYDGALELYGRLSADDRSLTYRPALTLIDRGAWHHDEGRLEAAERDQRAALALVESVPSDRRVELGERLATGMARLNLAGYAYERGRYEEARTEAARAVEWFEPLTQAERPFWVHRLLWIYARQSWIQASERVDAGFDAGEFDRLMADVTRLYTQNAGEFDIQFLHAELTVQQDQRAYERCRTPVEIRDVADRCRPHVRTLTSLYVMHRSIPYVRRAAAEACVDLAEMRLAHEDRAGAKQDLGFAMRYLKEGTRPEDDALLAGALDLQAQVAELEGETARAAELYEEAIDAHNRAILGRPERVQLQEAREETLVRRAAMKMGAGVE